MAKKSASPSKPEPKLKKKEPIVEPVTPVESMADVPEVAVETEGVTVPDETPLTFAEAAKELMLAEAEVMRVEDTERSERISRAGADRAKFGRA